MFAIDQTIDPFHDFFQPLWSFGSLFGKEKLANSINSASGESAVHARAQTLVPRPIFVLIIQIVAQAIIFSLLAGASLCILYLQQWLGFPDHYWGKSIFAALFSILLIADLALLLIAVMRNVIKALRDV